MLNASRYAGCNIGIVCGRVVAIDIDAEDPAEVAKIEALLESTSGGTRFQRVGRAPRTLHLYRPTRDEIIASTDFACIQVLSGGRQFVAFGTHPGTGKVYRWTGPSPATARIEELPTITAASVQAFAEAVCATLGDAQKRLPAASPRIVDAARKTRQRSRQGQMLGSVYDPRILTDADGRVIDGREALMAKITAAEYARGTHASPDDLGRRVWARFVEEADLSRPKGSNPRRRWELKDALSKARATCRKKPDLKSPRRSRRGHPASYLQSWRSPGIWTVAERDLHLVEVARRITTPATLATARVMIETVDLASGFCTMPIAEIAKRACCTPRWSGRPA
jgi:Bifunctional DNA primase/polymerase, N-terminal